MPKHPLSVTNRRNSESFNRLLNEKLTTSESIGAVNMSSTEFPAIPYPWLQSEWQRLMDQMAAQKLPHALMFSGQKGIGKRQLAQALAQYVLCLSPSLQSQLPCGHCKSCELNRVNSHPDFTIIEPEETGKAIKIDQIRALSDYLSKTSQQGGYKVVIIEPAEAMNTNAANALLKSLEEPSGDTLLILISHISSGVMATIRSRCQLRLLAAPHTEQAMQWLQPLVADNNAKDLLRFARGAPLAALELASGDALEKRLKLMQGFEAIISGMQSPLDIAKQWMSYESLEVVEWVLGLSHRLVCYQAHSQAAVVDELSPVLQGFVTRVSPQYLYRFIDKVFVLKQQLLSGANPNKQLLLEELLMDWGLLAKQANKVNMS